MMITSLGMMKQEKRYKGHHTRHTEKARRKTTEKKRGEIDG